MFGDQQAPEAARSQAADPKCWRALMVTQLAAFMVLLDVSIANVALPSIQRDLAVQSATAQWAVSGYALALGLTLGPAGRLGDSFGRRRMFILALAAFTITSALTGAAPRTPLLIAARLLPGTAVVAVGGGGAPAGRLRRMGGPHRTAGPPAAAGPAAAAHPLRLWRGGFRLGRQPSGGPAGPPAQSHPTPAGGYSRCNYLHSTRSTRRAANHNPAATITSKYAACPASAHSTCPSVSPRTSSTA